MAKDQEKQDKKGEKSDKPKGDITALEEKVTELENNWKRALADYRNLEKRFVEEREAIVQFANSTLILRMLPILDNLEMLEKHNNSDEGLKMILVGFRELLREEGIEEIEVAGKDFDANEMDALETVEGEKGKVFEVVKKGYKLKGRVLRPASVKVGSGKGLDDSKN